MARRKISIEEAFAVLEQAGIQVQMKSVQDADIKQHPVQVPPASPVPTQFTTTVQQGRSLANVKVTLFAAHSVGAGGTMVTNDDGSKSVVNAGVQTYGPGVVMVPRHLVGHLVYQDNLARQADERMLSREQRSYLVVEKRGADGQRVNVGMQVSNEVLNGGLGTLPLDYMHRLQ